MNPLARLLRPVFAVAEGGLDRVFGPAWNPLSNLGAIGFFFYWIVAVSGLYVYILFDTGLSEAYGSVEYMTVDHWYHAGIMRSLHRYASDGMVIAMTLHILREFSLDRYRGVRWFSWFTGVPILWLLFISGITGYWLVWDQLAQYVAVSTAEWLDWLPIFGEPIARNFLTPRSLDDRFFTLLVFIHIAAPLILLLVLWIHLQRISRSRINPPRGLAIGLFVMLLVLSLVEPATSHPPADLATVPTVLGLDWFYLLFYPLMELTSYAGGWIMAGALTFMLAVIPWMPPMRRPPVAVVDLENCNGCGRCVDDCPYDALTLAPRSDGQPFIHEAVVDPSNCVACGICAGACPTSTPFRRVGALRPGIDLPGVPLRVVRDAIHAGAVPSGAAPRILVVGCEKGVRESEIAAAGGQPLVLPCVGMLPPSFIDYVLSRDFADGVLLTGCRAGDCFDRFGIDWTEQRIAGERDPYLRARVPRERLATCWSGRAGAARLADEIAAFSARLAALEAVAPPERLVSNA